MEDTPWRLRRNKNPHTFSCWDDIFFGVLGMNYHHTWWIVGQITQSPMVGLIWWGWRGFKSSREIPCHLFLKHPRHLKGISVSNGIHPLLVLPFFSRDSAIENCFISTFLVSHVTFAEMNCRGLLGFTELVRRKATNRSKFIPIPKKSGRDMFFLAGEKGSVRTIYPGLISNL